MLQGFARFEQLCLEYPHIPISERLNPVEMIYQTALATIQTAKALSLVLMPLKCLTLLTAENVHCQNKFEAKHGYFMESSPLMRIGCTPNHGRPPAHTKDHLSISSYNFLVFNHFIIVII
jgi:hypothetical protein